MLLTGVWSGGAAAAWVVGGRPASVDLKTPAAPLMLSCDGAAWSSVTLPASDIVTSISGSASDDVWCTVGGPSVLHWNGKSWSDATPAAGAGRPFAKVTAVTARDVWLLTAYGATHWDGTAWTLESLGYDHGASALWSDGKDTFAVGGGGAILHLGR